METESILVNHEEEEILEAYQILDACHIAYSSVSNFGALRTFEDKTVGAIVWSQIQTGQHTELRFCIAVLPEFRGKGIAKALILDLIEEAQELTEILMEDVVISFCYAGKPWGKKMFKELGFVFDPQDRDYQLRLFV